MKRRENQKRFITKLGEYGITPPRIEYGKVLPDDLVEKYVILDSYMLKLLKLNDSKNSIPFDAFNKQNLYFVHKDDITFDKFKNFKKLLDSRTEIEEKLTDLKAKTFFEHETLCDKFFKPLFNANDRVYKYSALLYAPVFAVLGILNSIFRMPEYMLSKSRDNKEVEKLENIIDENYFDFALGFQSLQDKVTSQENKNKGKINHISQSIENNIYDEYRRTPNYGHDEDFKNDMTATIGHHLIRLETMLKNDIFTSEDIGRIQGLKKQLISFQKENGFSPESGTTPDAESIKKDKINRQLEKEDNYYGPVPIKDSRSPTAKNKYDPDDEKYKIPFK
jgi:hypothetical protein